MNTPITELQAAGRLAIAALIGLGIGLEREWSGHASGPDARFAGLRTFLLLGIIGGVAGLLLSLGHEAAGTAAIAGAMALCVGAYVTTTLRRKASIEGTTEAASLAAVALGAMAGTGWMALAAGTGSLIVLALREKTRLHWLVRRVSEPELHGALQFAVLALVILPLLPSGPYLGSLEIRPRALWMVVLFFSALNFAGFLARRAVGPNAGYILTGLLGGLLSSTAVTLQFSRESRESESQGSSLGYGVIGACTMLLPRVVAVSAVLNQEVAVQLAMMLVFPLLIGGLLLWFGWRRHNEGNADPSSEPRNPLRLWNAVKMAIAFQVAFTALALVRDRWGTPALFPSAAALGFTDMDALTVSMNRLEGSVSSTLAAQAIVIGILSNTVLKFGIAAVIGRGAFRKTTLVGLTLLAIATVASIAFMLLRGNA